MTMGPFEISAQRVAALGTHFTPFINKLLEVQAAAHHLAGHLLAINSQDTIADGGVDAASRQVPEGSSYMPAGDTAWQFKRTGLGPKACADEFETAAWAHEFLRQGGNYVIALGAPLTDNLIERRRKRIFDKAVEMGLLAASDAHRIRVYDANLLARWASQFPALAVSRLSAGPGSVAVDFDAWASGRTHTVAEWVPDVARTQALADIREQVSSNGIVDVRVQGESGIGKTRLVLEALRDDRFRSLVAYVADEHGVGGELLAHLVNEGRTAILVVDECPAERHVKLVEKLPADPSIKMITIGDVGPAATRSPVLAVAPVPAETTEEFLKANYPHLDHIARRFIVEHSFGNMRWTILLADRITGATDPQAAELIARDDIEQFIAAMLPEGRDFFHAAVLALFERVGWDGDKRHELERVAELADCTLADMEAVAITLEQNGLLMRQGRYRSVTPQPLAVYLAAEGWRLLGERVVADLLPKLDSEMALRLFRRAADLGRYEPARAVLPALLAEQGPFSTLERIADLALGQILTELAIVLPDEMAIHLAELIDAASLDWLREHREIRRDLVWTLEKLAWHSRTFVRAADALLRLALAENETYANNATGTWTDLFGTMLPGTAARPEARAAYLQRVAERPEAEARLLVTQAAVRAFAHHETITVSGEVQGGVIVESRGTPETWGEAANYRKAVIDTLVLLTSDPEPTVSRSAEDVLIDALPVLGDDPLAGDALAYALTGLSGEAVRRLRISAQRLLALYDRTESTDRPIRERVTQILDALPTPDPDEMLDIVLRLHSWDLRDGELQRRIEQALQDVVERNELLSVLARSLASEIPAGWQLGHALAAVVGDHSGVSAVLREAVKANPSVLAGYLHALETSGHTGAVQRFLEAPMAEGLSEEESLRLATVAPATPAIRDRIFGGLRRLSVAKAASIVFAWRREISQPEMIALIEEWASRIESQEDYNALIDWLSLYLHPDVVIPVELRETVWSLLRARLDFPAVGREAWDWGRLALPFAKDRASDLTTLVLDLVERGLLLHDTDQEAHVLRECATTDPQGVWSTVAARLEAGRWRISMVLDDWFLPCLPPEVVLEWLHGDVERARLIASMVPVDGESPPELVRALLAEFGEDEEVGSGLYASLVSGSWTGNESARLTRQIADLTKWRMDPEQPESLRSWARRVVEYLERRRTEVLQYEAEERF